MKADTLTLTLVCRHFKESTYLLPNCRAHTVLLVER